MSRVVVGLSGGVDSAVAAYLLKAAGHDVIGLTLRTWPRAGEESRCCQIDDARRAAWHMGIPYYVEGCLTEFRRYVTEPFMEAYLRGRTPNPCVSCNRCVKWARMLQTADRLGAEYVATGHYAVPVRTGEGRYTLRRAASPRKDQTYMLCALTQEQLRRTLLPLGRLDKEEVRAIAARVGLPVAQKKDSQEICFVTEGNYYDYIAENSPTPLPDGGNFVDEAGNVLGRHEGIVRYTVGQRRGLGLALGAPAYVKRIDADANEVVIAPEEALYASEILCGEMNYMGLSEPPPGTRLRARVKIRYRHDGETASAEILENGRIRVLFDRPVRAPTPGQSAVLYDSGDLVLAGGVIL